MSEIKQYQGFFLLDGKPDFESEVLSQLRAWLSEKGFDVDFKSNFFKKTSFKELVVLSNKASDGKSYRLKLLERQPTGDFNVDILLHVDLRLDSWILVRATTTSGVTPKPPRVVNYIIEQGLAVDGGTPLIRNSRLIRQLDVEDLVAHLTDPERRALYLIAGSSSAMNFDNFKRDVDKWTRDTSGLAHVVVLDPVATSEFSQRVGRDFEVPAGTIRTFRPHVDFAEPFSARQHRIVGEDRLKTGTAKIVGLFGYIAQVNLENQGIPTYVTEATRRMQRVEHRYLMGLLSEQAERMAGQIEVITDQAETDETQKPLAIETPAIDLQIELTKKLEDSDTSTLSNEAEAKERQDLVDYLLEQVEAIEIQNEELENKLGSATLEIKDLEYESAWQVVHSELIESELEKVNRENIYLKEQLRKLGDFNSQYIDIPSSKNFSIENWDELLQFINDSPYLEFTGDLEAMLDILDHDPNQKALNIAFLAAQCLHNYCEAKLLHNFAGEVDLFIKNPPSGFGYRTFPPNKHARGESGFTKERQKEFSRVFPVPREINSEGEETMVSHFKLGGEYPTRPTLYYLDRVNENKKIIIGYIGLHLTNRLS